MASTACFPLGLSLLTFKHMQRARGVAAAVWIFHVDVLCGCFVCAMCGGVDMFFLMFFGAVWISLVDSSNVRLF